MDSWLSAIPNTLPPCPGAWPAAEAVSLTRIPTANNHATTTELSYSKMSSPRRKQNPPPRKQITLKRTMLDGTCTLSLSGDPIMLTSKRDHYSTPRSYQNGTENPRPVLKQTRIKQDTTNGQLRLSTDDINELCKVLARISLSDPGISRPPYGPLRTPISKSNKPRRKHPSASSPSSCRSRRPLTLEPPGSSGRSIFSSSSFTPDTPNTPPFSRSPSSLKASRQRRNNHPDESDFSPTPASRRTFSSAECSPSPPQRHQWPNGGSSSSPVVNSQKISPRDGCYGSFQFRLKEHPIVASPVSKFIKPLKSSRTLHMLDDEIEIILVNGPSAKSNTIEVTNGESPTAVRKKRLVYVLSRPTSRGFVKIGSGDMDARIKDISRGGAYGDLIPYHHPRQRHIRHYKFGERIVHKELCNIRYTSDYTPTFKEHITSRAEERGRTEWFHTDKEHAVEVVFKWVEWLDSDPYDEAGRLSEFWRRRIQNRERYDEEKHGDMHARWSAVLKQPTENQLWLFKMTRGREVVGTLILRVLNKALELPPWVLVSAIIMLAVLYISA